MGVVNRRWAMNGVLTLLAGAIVLVGGLGLVLAWAGAWGAVGGWLADSSTLVTLVALPAALAALFAAATWAVLRRTVP